jgi:hypothetical protein
MKLKSLLSLIFGIGLAFNLHGQILPAAFGVATPSRPVANTIVTSGLVLNLDASNASSYPGSGATWTDMSSSGNNGTLTNGPTYSSLNGGSLVFDGSNDFVSFSSGLPSSDDLTYEAWVNSSSFSGFNVILNHDNWSTGYVHFQFDQGALHFDLHCCQVEGQNISSTYTFSTNTWYQVAAVYSKSLGQVSFYVNGTLTNTFNLTGSIPTITNSTFKMGSWNGNDRFFNGKIGLVRIYNRALTTAEVLQNYNALRPRFLSIGDSYGGGKLAYVLKAGDPGYDATTPHGLIAATSDYPTRIQWWNGSYITTGATATALGTGFANTNTIIAAQGTGSYAASVARNHTEGGYSDWYLPSKDELYKLWENRTAIGNFNGDWYYSSSENTGTSPATAWLIGRTSGTWWPNVKHETWSVRAIRAF